MLHRFPRKAVSSVAAGLAVLLSSQAMADAVADFYKGKNVTIVVAAGPGGGHSVYSQLIAPGLTKYTPGNPTFVIQNMGGAGGTKAANYLANSAPQDGGYLGILLQDTPLAARLRATGIKYDPGKFHYLGGADITRSAFVVTKRSGVKTLQDAMQKEVLLGSSGKGSQTFIVPTLVNALIGTKFKTILGYRGMGGIYLGMERGEVNGFQSVWSSLSYIKPDWVAKGDAYPIAAMSLDRLPDRPDTPLVIDLVKNPVDRKIVELSSGSGVIGRCWLAPPKIPADRLAALRTAFEKTFADPEIAAQAKKRKLPWEPVKWQDLQEQVQRIATADDATIGRLRGILGIKAK
jgi:tripartite-type tricarboxylate transporter receptor subunit TctC